MSYCPRHDPLLRAGQAVCGRCGSIAYPVDAAWLTATLVVADFPDLPCGHGSGRAWVVDTAALAPPHRWCHRPTRAGEPCRRRTGVDGGHCRAHRQEK